MYKCIFFVVTDNELIDDGMHMNIIIHSFILSFMLSYKFVCLLVL